MTQINQQLDIYTAEIDYSAPASHPLSSSWFPSVVRRRNPRSMQLFVTSMLSEHADIIKEIRTYNPQGELVETVRGKA